MDSNIYNATNIEKDCGALGGLFQQIINDMKSSSPIWEDFLNKATKLHGALRTTVAATTAFLDTFQKVADLATNTKGATKEMGSSLTRLCIRHRSIEKKLKEFTNAILEVLVLPLQDKKEDWKARVMHLDKEHAKEYKKARAEIKRATSDTMRLQKKLKKGKSDIQGQLNTALQDVTDKFLLLEETEKNSVRGALMEQRAQFCQFLYCFKPVVDGEITMVTEVTHLQEILDALCAQAGDPHTLPPSSEQVIHDLKGGDSQTTYTYQTPPSSPSSLGSRKSSMCSINSLNSNSSGSTHANSPSHHVRHRPASQPLPPGTVRLSSVSSQDSGFTSQDALFLRPPSPSLLDFRRKSSAQESSSSSGTGTDSGGTTPSPSYPVPPSAAVSTWANWPDPPYAIKQDSQERPHTISTAYERSHSRPALSAEMFEPPEGGGPGEKAHKTAPPTPNPYAVPCIVPGDILRQKSRLEGGRPPSLPPPPLLGPKPRAKPVPAPMVPETLRRAESMRKSTGPPPVYINTRELATIPGAGEDALPPGEGDGTPAENGQDTRDNLDLSTRSVAPREVPNKFGVVIHKAISGVKHTLTKSKPPRPKPTEAASRTNKQSISRSSSVSKLPSMSRLNSISKTSLSKSNQTLNSESDFVLSAQSYEDLSTFHPTVKSNDAEDNVSELETESQYERIIEETQARLGELGHQVSSQNFDELTEAMQHLNSCTAALEDSLTDGDADTPPNRLSMPCSSGYGTMTNSPACSEGALAQEVDRNTDSELIHATLTPSGDDFVDEFAKFSTMPRIRNRDISQSFRLPSMHKRPVSVAGGTTSAIQSGMATIRRSSVQATARAPPPPVRRNSSISGAMPVLPPSVPKLPGHDGHHRRSQSDATIMCDTSAKPTAEEPQDATQAPYTGQGQGQGQCMTQSQGQVEVQGSEEDTEGVHFDVSGDGDSDSVDDLPLPPPPEELSHPDATYNGAGYEDDGQAPRQDADGNKLRRQSSSITTTHSDIMNTLNQKLGARRPKSSPALQQMEQPIYAIPQLPGNQPPTSLPCQPHPIYTTPTPQGHAAPIYATPYAQLQPQIKPGQLHKSHYRSLDSPDSTEEVTPTLETPPDSFLCQIKRGVSLRRTISNDRSGPKFT